MKPLKEPQLNDQKCNFNALFSSETFLVWMQHFETFAVARDLASVPCDWKKMFQNVPFSLFSWLIMELEKSSNITTSGIGDNLLRSPDYVVRFLLTWFTMARGLNTDHVFKSFKLQYLIFNNPQRCEIIAVILHLINAQSLYDACS